MIMKKCTMCKEDKELTEFNKNKVRPDGLNNICGVCSRANSRQYYIEHSDKHKKAVFKRNQQQRKDNKVFLDEIKSSGCTVCSENDPSCMDFHHIDPTTKTQSVGSLSTRAYNKATLIKEIAKCVLLCSICYRKFHAGKITI